MSVDSPSKQSKAEQLRRLARPLRPERPPFYVQHPTADCPLAGWWWTPAGSPAPVPLAGSALDAIARLCELTHQLKAAA